MEHQLSPRNIFASFFLLLLFSNVIVAQQYLDQTLMHDGELRKYTIYIPANYDENISTPMLFNFHGGGSDITSQIFLSEMDAIADTANFIVVYPQALADPNDDGSTNWLHKEPTDVDDVFIVDKIIEEISAEFEIDETRIYACGYSLGGEFTYELACRLNEQIAAVGIVARTMGTAAYDNCVPSHPTGILTILGTDDFISPYEGLVWGGIQYYLSADDTHEYWANYNNTTSSPTITQLPDLNPSDGSTVEHYVWENGDNCVTIEHLKINGGGHDWPGSFGNEDINASEEIWKFVSKFDINGLTNCITATKDDFITSNEILIFPNPVSQFINIETNQLTNQKFQIFNQLGEMLYSGNIESFNFRLDLSHLPSGFYFFMSNHQAIKFLKT